MSQKQQFKTPRKSSRLAGMSGPRYSASPTTVSRQQESFNNQQIAQEFLSSLKEEQGPDVTGLPTQDPKEPPAEEVVEGMAHDAQLPGQNINTGEIYSAPMHPHAIRAGGLNDVHTPIYVPGIQRTLHSIIPKTRMVPAQTVLRNQNNRSGFSTKIDAMPLRFREGREGGLRYVVNKGIEINDMYLANLKEGYSSQFKSSSNDSSMFL